MFKALTICNVQSEKSIVTFLAHCTNKKKETMKILILAFLLLAFNGLVWAAADIETNKSEW